MCNKHTVTKHAFYTAPGAAGEEAVAMLMSALEPREEKPVWEADADPEADKVGQTCTDWGPWQLLGVCLEGRGRSAHETAPTCWL